MSKTPPKQKEQLVADVEKWQLEMAEELGLVHEVRAERPAGGGRSLLRSHHFYPKDRTSQPKR